MDREEARADALLAGRLRHVAMLDLLDHIDRLETEGGRGHDHQG